MSSVLDLVAKITLDTTEYDKGLDNSKTKAGSFGDKLKKGFTAVGALAVKGLGAASAAAGAFGLTSVKTGMKFDSAMSQVAATMGKTSAEMQDEIGTVDLKWGKFSGNLREYAQEMGANTAFSATQAAEALNYMALAGYSTQTSMEMLPNVLNLAAAGNMDLARASDMVTDTQTAFGMNIKRTTQMVDEMAKAASTGNTSVEQLGDAFLVVGGLAQDLNGGFITLSDGTKKPVDGVQELEIALTAMANAGIKGSEAGTHMRNMLLKLSDPTSEGADLLGQLGISAFDSEGNMRSLSDTFGDLKLALDGMTQQGKIEAISALFNTRDIASAEAILNAVESDWDNIGESILDAEGAAQKMADTQLDNLEGDITIFKSALEGAQIAISDGLSPTLRGFVKEGSDGLTNFRNAVKDGDLSGAIAGLGATIANLSVKVVKQVPHMVEAGAQLLSGIGQGLLDNAPTLLNSAGELVTFLYNGILQNAPSVISGGAQMIANVAQGITEHLPEMASKATELIVTVSESLAAQLPTLAESGLQLVTGLAQAIMGNAPVLVQSAIGMIKNLGQGLVSGIPQFLENALPMVEQFTGMLRENAGKLVDAGMGLILNIAQGIANSIPTLVEHIPQIVINIAGVINDNAPKLLSTGVQVVGKLIGGIISALPTIAANIPKIIQAIVSVFFAFNWLQLGGSIITSITNGVKSLASSLPEAIKNIGQTAMDWLSAINWQTLGADIIDLIVIGVQSLVTAIPSALQSIGTTAVELFKSIDWLGVGTFVIEGLISGINGLLDAAVGAIKGVGTAILDGFKSLFGINSPSTVMEEQGNFLIEGLTNALTALPGAILGFLTDGLNNVITWGSDLASKGLEAAQNFAGNVGDGFSKAKQWVSDTVGNIKEKVGEGFGTAKEKVSNAVGNIKDKVGTGFSAAQKNVANAAKSIKDGVTKSFSAAKENAVKAATNIKSGISTNFTSAKSAVTSAMTNIKSGISNGITTAKSTVVTAVTNIKDKLSGLSSVASTVSKIFDDIKKKISDKIGDAKDAVSNGIEKIKSKLKFSWSLPKLKLPHFSVSGKFSLNPPSVPHFSIDWYDRAMRNGILLDGATIFGARNGKLLGGGETGREVVIGEQKALNLISKAAGNEKLTERVNYLIRLLEYYLPKRTTLTGREMDRILGAML